LGFAKFTVQGVFKPGRYPTRVFFTRAFTDPDGKTLGIIYLTPETASGSYLPKGTGKSRN
jgi:hypothetical protein